MFAIAQKELSTSLYALPIALQQQEILDSVKDSICFMGQMKSMFNNFIDFFLKRDWQGSNLRPSA